jgi:arsenate reductase
MWRKKESARETVREGELLRFKAVGEAGLKTILFVCTGNAVRSQIAEAIVNHFLKERWAAFSAGVMPMEVPRDLVKVMGEIGIDISAQRAKHVDIFRDCRFDRVIVLCSDAGRMCPTLPDCEEQEHMIFHDPLSCSLFSEGLCFGLKSTLRTLRDEMKQKLMEYLREDPEVRSRKPG